MLRRGGLPPASMFRNLQELDLSNNSMSGSLPPDYAGLQQLQMLMLSANQLTGCAQTMAYATGKKPMRCSGYLRPWAFSGVGIPCCDAGQGGR